MAQDTGKAIRRQRQILGMTQDELAERIGVDRSAVSAWERGVHFPLRYQGKIEEVLRIDLDHGEREPAEVARNQDDPVVGYVWGLDLAEEVRLGIIRIYLRQVGRAGLAAASSARVA